MYMRTYGDNIVVCSTSNVPRERQQCAFERISLTVSAEWSAFNDRVFCKLTNGTFELVVAQRLYCRSLHSN